MFFFLSKILSFIITPIGWVTALLLISLFSKRPGLKKRSFIAGLSLLLFFSNSFILDEFMRGWEVPAVSIGTVGDGINHVSTYDAGIVLGGMLSYDTKLDRIQFYRSTDRLLQAVELYKTGKIRKLFFTGGSGYILKPDEKEGVFIKKYLLELGIPENDILIENESRNTRENAIFCRKILAGHPEIKNILLITSGIHMKRAMGCFSKAGILVSPYSTDRYSGPRKFELDHLLIPNASALYNWEAFTHEFLGYITYKVAGYL